MKWFENENQRTALLSQLISERVRREQQAMSASHPDPALLKTMLALADGSVQRSQERSARAWEQARQTAMKARWKL